MPGGDSKYKNILNNLNSYEKSTDLVSDIGKIKAKGFKSFTCKGAIGAAIINFKDARLNLKETLDVKKIASIRYLKFDPNEKGEVKINSENKTIISRINALKEQKSLFVKALKEFLDKKENELPKEILDKLWRLVEKEYNETLKLKEKVGKVIYLKKLSAAEFTEIWKMRLSGPQIIGVAQNVDPVDMIKMDSSHDPVIVTFSMMSRLPQFNICFACIDKQLLVFVGKENHYMFEYNEKECFDEKLNLKYFKFTLNKLVPITNICFNDKGNLEINK